jgi:hypothetical protein
MPAFEDRFSEIQAEMVSLCLEYADENKAEDFSVDNIYIYCSCETVEDSTWVEGNLFFRVDGKLIDSHMINGAETFKDCVPEEQQDAVLDALSECIEEARKVCKEFDRPMPTEMKLVYDVKSGNLDAAYQYDLILDKGEGKTCADVLEEWYAQLAKE